MVMINVHNAKVRKFKEHAKNLANLFQIIFVQKFVRY